MFVDAAGAAGGGEGLAGVSLDGWGFDAGEVGCDDALAAGALPTVTSGVILAIVKPETPAFDKSLTEE